MEWSGSRGRMYWVGKGEGTEGGLGKVRFKGLGFKVIGRDR